MASDAGGHHMGDLKSSMAPGLDHPPRLLTRHGLLPLHSVPAYGPVPAWEKCFVTDVCCIPWKRLLEAKKLTSVCRNIVDWDDSGAQENFENEKARFFAELNGLRCEIPLPAPDLYLDNVDYKAEIDSKITADLEKPPPQPPATASRGWDSFILAERVPVTGWGDAEDPVQLNCETPADKRTVPTGWEQKNSGDSLNHIAAWDNNSNNNLLGGRQVRHNPRNDSSENKNISRNFNGRIWDGYLYGNRWTRSRYRGTITM